MSGKQEEE